MGLFTKVSIIPEVPALGSLEDLPNITLAVNHTIKAKKIVNTSEFDYEQIILVSQKRLTVYKISWNPITKTEADQILTFWKDHQGGIRPFLWSGPSGQFTQPRKFHFVSGLGIDKLAPQVYSVNATVEEIF